MRKVKNKHVLLLGNDDRVMLSVIRSLGRQGLNVHVGWCPEKSVALSSQYVHKIHSLPAYSPDDDHWITELQALLNAFEFELVIPCNDPAIIPLQLNREKFESLAKIYLLEDAAFQTAFDKLATTELAMKLGVNVPTTSIVRSDRDESWRELSLPVFVKPRSSITEQDVQNKREAQRADTPEELENVIGTLGIADGLLIQEYFEGVGAGVEVLVNQGVVHCELHHIRIHETIDGGSTYRKSVAANAELSNATHQIMKELNYTGVAMVEFRLNQETGQWAMLEINARFWGSLPLAIAAGLNFPWFLYQMLVDGKTDFPKKYQQVRCRNLLTDSRWMARQLISSKSFHGLYLSRLLLARDHVDQWARDDLQPVFRELCTLASGALTKIFGRSQNAMSK